MSKFRVHLVVAVGSILLIVIGVTFARNAYVEPQTAATGTMRLALSKQQTRLLATQSIRFTLYPEGIFPRQARVHSGLVAVSVEDLTGGRSIMRVEQLLDGGTTRGVADVVRTETHWRGRSVIELEPGLYRLSLPQRNASTAELLVEP